MQPHLKRTVLLPVSILFYMIAVAQYTMPAPTNDTSYYERYRPKLSITPHISTRFGGMNLYNTSNDASLKYRINNAARLGLDLGYDFLTIGGSIGIGHADPTYKKNKGRTSSFNLETTINSQSLLVDVFYLKHKGHYTLLPDANNAYYVRPDLETRMTGVSGLYVLNGKRYSTRPVFKYDTWQKKSAGSLMVGMDFLFSKALADSSFIPSVMSDVFNNSSVRKTKTTLMGPAIGYGHHLVISRQWFVTAIATFKADIARIKEWDEAGHQKQVWRFAPNMNIRGGVGYGTENTQWAFSYVINHAFLKSNTDALRYTFSNEEYKVSYTTRINAGRAVPGVVHFVGNIIEWLQLGFLLK